jgi:hypothetical protein
LWSNSMRRMLLSICGLAEESTAVGVGAWFVCPGFEAKDRVSRVRVVRARASGRVMVGG